MRRHLILLDRECSNLESARRFCAELTDCREKLDTLDASALLNRMEQLEQEGTTFMDRQKQDIKRRRYVAPVLSALVMALLMGFMIWLMVWAFEVDPLGAPPLPILILLIAIPAVVILGVGIALYQRIREIGRNKDDDYKKY